MFVKGATEQKVSIGVGYDSRHGACDESLSERIKTEFTSATLRHEASMSQCLNFSTMTYTAICRNQSANWTSRRWIGKTKDIDKLDWIKIFDHPIATHSTFLTKVNTSPTIMLGLLTIQTSCHVAKYLQHIWRSIMSRWIYRSVIFKWVAVSWPTDRMPW